MDQRALPNEDQFEEDDTSDEEDTESESSEDDTEIEEDTEEETERESETEEEDTSLYEILQMENGFTHYYINSNSGRNGTTTYSNSRLFDREEEIVYATEYYENHGDNQESVIVQDSNETLRHDRETQNPNPQNEEDTPLYETFPPLRILRPIRPARPVRLARPAHPVCPLRIVRHSSDFYHGDNRETVNNDEALRYDRETQNPPAEDNTARRSVKRKAEDILEEGELRSVPAVPSLLCPVCKDTLVEKRVVIPECGHLICDECMQTILSGRGACECPICRRFIRRDTLRDVHF